MEQLLKRFSFRNENYKMEKQTEDEYEICILCGKKTNVKRTAHIDLRDGYVEGCGQLCPACCKIIYK